jgi:hypothetical protein
LGDGGTVRKLVVATTAGADDAMPARREKAIFGLESKIEEYNGIVGGGEERGLSEEYKGVARKMEKII